MESNLDNAAADFVEAGGVRYGFKTFGTGTPLLLLHGAFGTSDMFGAVAHSLIAHHRVIAVDLYGHGRTALTDRPVDAVAIADDLASVVRALGLNRIDVMGLSFGGMIAFRLAVQHPELVNRLVLVSTPYTDAAYYPAVLAQQRSLTRAAAEQMMKTRLYEVYKSVAPRVEDFPELVARMGESMREPFDWSSDARALEPSALLVYGDSDIFQLDHIIRFYHLLGGGQREASWDGSGMVRHRLAILPGATHYSISNDPLLAEAALRFLQV